MSSAIAMGKASVAADELREEPLDIIAADGRRLSGLLVTPSSPRRSILVSSAVAIPKERYLPFARDAAARGAAVLVYDYRSQGHSVQGDISEDLASLVDWGHLDMDAAIRALDQRYPDIEMTAVEHSIAAWILGLCQAQHRIDRHAFVCAGWGYWKLKPPTFRCVEMFFWHVYGPLQIRRHGHVPKGGLWKGEALNRRFFADWKQRCHSAECSPDIIAGGSALPHHFAAVRAPIRSFAYSDDPIANPRTVPMILSLYPAAQREAVWATPADHGLASIGHEGLFSRRAARAWTPVLDWIAPLAQSPRPADK